MLSRKPYIVARFDKEITLNRKESINFSYKESEISGDKERLSNRLWIKLDRSASEIVQDTKKILELCRFSERDLIVHFK